MILSEVIYNGNLRTSSKHLKSGQIIISDAPIDNKGKGEAFSPTDLVANSLATCMLTTMGIRANEANINIDNSKAGVTKIMASNPRRIAEICIQVLITNIKLDSQQKELLENAAKNCPVAKSLHPEIKQVVSFEYK